MLDKDDLKRLRERAHFYAASAQANPALIGACGLRECLQESTHFMRMALFGAKQNLGGSLDRNVFRNAALHSDSCYCACGMHAC